MTYRSRTVIDADGRKWEVSVEISVRNPDNLIATTGELRDALPGPVREHLIDHLRDDIKMLL